MRCEWRINVKEVFMINLLRNHLDWRETVVCCVFPCCQWSGQRVDTEDRYLLPPEILCVDRKLQSVTSSEVSLIGRAPLLTAVCPGRHGHLAGRTVSGRSRGTSSPTAPPRLLQLLLRLHCRLFLCRGSVSNAQCVTMKKLWTSVTNFLFPRNHSEPFTAVNV